LAAARAKVKRRRREAEPAWSELSDDALLDLPLRKLNLRLPGSWVEPRVEQLYDELAARKIRLRPHVWLAEEWFAPEGVPGIAIPFYLAHPRLMRLERRMMGQAEGGTHDSCMQILRHEAGHAIDNAYKLRRRRERQRMFGLESTPYRQYYRPNPQSKRFVVHLDYWYAQAHPAEDFAETFAVWLTPRHPWRRRYADWPALRKLEYVEALMLELRGQKPPVASREQLEPLSELRSTLREHYAAKQAHYAQHRPSIPDRDLQRLFAAEPGRQGEPAARFLRRHRGEVRRMVARFTGESPYALERVLDDVTSRCQMLDLRVSGSLRRLTVDVALLLTVRTVHFHYSRRNWVAL